MERLKSSEDFVKKIFSEVLEKNVHESDSFQSFYDFYFSEKGKKYFVEVKTKFLPSYMSKTISYMKKNMKENNVYGIIVILDRVPDIYKSLSRDEQNIEIIDISNIMYLIYDNQILQAELNEIIDFSLDRIIPKKINIDFIIEKKQTIIEKNEYHRSLSGIKGGKRDAKKYEEAMEEIIRNIFSNELTLFQAQLRTEDGINIFDMICKIKNDINDEFFYTIEKFYKTKYILFEFKNYNEVIKQGEICSTEKYLYETALRKVAIIITRVGIDDNGMKLAKGILRESGKLIIVLNDNDVNEMIQLHESGEQASKVLGEKLDEILTKLEK